MTLQVAGLSYRWPGAAGFSLAVTDFSVAPGERVLLLGESGSGKSTLLSLICGTLLPGTGRVDIAGTDITTLSGSARDRFRAEQIGVIFQQFNLLPFGTVADNIMLPLHFAPERRAREGDARAAAQHLSQKLGLPDSLFTARAGRLSVGQQQRVAVARALIGQPPLIIADEPTSAMDAKSQGSFLSLLFEQSAAHNAALLMVSHDTRLADHFDRVANMEDIATIGRAAA